MNKVITSTAALAAVIVLVAAPQALAAGGQNAYNNPTGEPAEDTYQTPYANAGGGRMLVFCADNETLVMTPAADGAMELTCVAAE
jgi:hypothetical protein